MVNNSDEVTDNIDNSVIHSLWRPYAIENQQGASKKTLVGGLECDELVLYGIRVLAEQLLGTVLDMEVDLAFLLFSLSSSLTVLTVTQGTS